MQLWFCTCGSTPHHTSRTATLQNSWGFAFVWLAAVAVCGGINLDIILKWTAKKQSALNWPCLEVWWLSLLAQSAAPLRPRCWDARWTVIGWSQSEPVGWSCASQISPGLPTLWGRREHVSQFWMTLHHVSFFLFLYFNYYDVLSVTPHPPHVSFSFPLF